MQSIFENFLCAPEKIVYFVFFRYHVLKTSIKSDCSILPFRISDALVIICLEDLSIDVSGVLKSPIINLFLLVSPFMSIVFVLCI